MPNKKLPKIYFLVNNPKNGSSVLRAFQIAEALGEFGYDTTVYSMKSLKSLEWKEVDKNLPPNQRRKPPRNKFMVYDMEDKPHMLGSIKNSIVVILKKAQQSQLNYLKRSGKNKLVLDPIDYIYWTKYPALYSTLKSYDAVICCNSLMKKDLLSKYPHPDRIHVIYHHWDVRLRGREVNYKEEKYPFGILFSGFVEGLAQDAHHKLVDNLNCYHLDQFEIKMTKDVVMHPELKLPFHYNIRQNNTWCSNFKSNIKLSNAAALGSNIITTPDQSYQEVFELAGESIENYPYVTDDSVENVSKVIEQARNDYEAVLSSNEQKGNTERWNRGLIMMNRIKKSTDLREIIKDYVNLFENL